MNNSSRREEQVAQVAASSRAFLSLHSTNTVDLLEQCEPLTGKFSLMRSQSEPDLYGMLDAVFILFTIGDLAKKTNRESRRLWADRIIDCQDDDGWFSKRNLRGHSREHATAYALGALNLLAIHNDESHLHRIRPLTGILPVLIDRKTFSAWIKRLDFQVSASGIAKKKLGWHYVWRGSHVGGGVAAAVGMTRHVFHEWWHNLVDVDAWFNDYFDWLDSHVNPKSGFWQLAFWNHILSRPTVIDLGGAVHFYWIYNAYGRRFPFPQQVIHSTATLQRPSGLYRKHPYCIDFDGNFCMIRSYLQLDSNDQQQLRPLVYQKATSSFEGIIEALDQNSFESIYEDSHGLPGALVALVECKNLPDFPYTDHLAEWQNPLNVTWWL